MTAELSPSVVSDERIVHRESLRGGQAWSRRLRRHEVLRIVDSTGKACVSALFYNARHPLERYNMPDTLKAQHIARLSIPFPERVLDHRGLKVTKRAGGDLFDSKAKQTGSDSA